MFAFVAASLGILDAAESQYVAIRRPFFFDLQGPEKIQGSLAISPDTHGCSTK
jgi:hypothetical protein